MFKKFFEKNKNRGDPARRRRKIFRVFLKNPTGTPALENPKRPKRVFAVTSHTARYEHCAFIASLPILFPSDVEWIGCGATFPHPLPDWFPVWLQLAFCPKNSE